MGFPKSDHLVCCTFVAGSEKRPKVSIEVLVLLPHFLWPQNLWHSEQLLPIDSQRDFLLLLAPVKIISGMSGGQIPIYIGIVYTKPVTIVFRSETVMKQ